MCIPANSVWGNPASLLSCWHWLLLIFKKCSQSDRKMLFHRCFNVHFWGWWWNEKKKFFDMYIGYMDFFYIGPFSHLLPVFYWFVSTIYILNYFYEPYQTWTEKDTCTPMFTAALFTTANTWKQPRCPSTDEWIKKLWYMYTVEYSVQFSLSVVSDSLRPHEWQHARPPCPSPTPWVHSNSCASSQWCHPAISSSVVPFSSCP